MSDQAIINYQQLSRFSRRAINRMIDSSDKHSKQAVRKIGQRAVKLTKAAMKANGIGTKTALYKAVKKTGVWGVSHDNWCIRTYMSSSARNAQGESGRGHAWFVEHGHRVVTKTGIDTGKRVEGKHYQSQAIPNMDEEFVKVLEEHLDKLINEGLALGF